MDRGRGARGEPAGEVEGGGDFVWDRLDRNPAQLRGLVGSTGERREKEKRKGEVGEEGVS